MTIYSIIYLVDVVYILCRWCYYHFAVHAGGHSHEGEALIGAIPRLMGGGSGFGIGGQQPLAEYSNRSIH